MRVLILFVLVSLGSQAYAQSLKFYAQRLKYGFLSAVIPGAGQVANPEQPRAKGFLILLSAVGGVTIAYYAGTKASQPSSLPNQATNRNMAHSWVSTAVVMSTGMIVFWIWNVIDAATYDVRNHSYRKPKNKKLQLFTRSTYGYNEIGLRLYLN